MRDLTIFTYIHIHHIFSFLYNLFHKLIYCAEYLKYSIKIIQESKKYTIHRNELSFHLIMALNKDIKQR